MPIETWHLHPLCRCLYSRIWASPTPYQNLVRSTNGMDPTSFKSGLVWTQDLAGNRCLPLLLLLINIIPTLLTVCRPYNSAVHLNISEPYLHILLLTLNLY